ncbi:unnamed protein product, partial [Polarella glacialis]
TCPVTQDHRVAGWSRALRAERIQLKEAAGLAASGTSDKETRTLVHELEKRLAAAERAKEDALKSADTRQGRAHDFQEKYLGSLQHQESMQERLLSSEEEHLRACQALVEAQLEATEVRDEMSELQYKDNILLMMLEQEAADLQTDSTRSEDLLESLAAVTRNQLESSSESAHHEVQELKNAGEELREAEAAREKQVSEENEAQERRFSEEAKDLRLTLDTMSEAKMQQEIAFQVDKGNLENKLEALRLEMVRAGTDSSRGALEEAVASQEANQELRTSSQEALEASKIEVRKLRHSYTESREMQELEAQQLRDVQASSEAAAAVHREARQDFQEQLLRLAEKEDGTSEAGSQPALSALMQQLNAADQREQGLTDDCRNRQVGAMELHRRLVRASAAALDWAPEDADEVEKEQIRSGLLEGVPDAVQDLSAESRNLREELLR